MLTAFASKEPSGPSKWVLWAWLALGIFPITSLVAAQGEVITSGGQTILVADAVARLDNIKLDSPKDRDALLVVTIACEFDSQLDRVESVTIGNTQLKLAAGGNKGISSTSIWYGLLPPAEMPNLSVNFSANPSGHEASISFHLLDGVWSSDPLVAGWTTGNLFTSTLSQAMIGLPDQSILLSSLITNNKTLPISWEAEWVQPYANQEVSNGSLTHATAILKPSSPPMMSTTVAWEPNNRALLTTAAFYFEKPDVESPTVSPETLSADGATGINGAFIVGDIMRLSWDNSASGDQNPDIVQVWFDLSPVGGPVRLSATNENDLWSASLPLARHPIDTLQGSFVMHVLNRDGGETFISQEGLKMDLIPPSLNPESIVLQPFGILPATSGDSIEVIWSPKENEVHSDIDQVLVDFTSMGGSLSLAQMMIQGNQLPAQWSATFTIQSGGPSGENLKPMVRVIDDAGNLTIAEPVSGLQIFQPSLNIQASQEVLIEGNDVVGHSYTISLDTLPAGPVELLIRADSQSSISLDGTAYSGELTLALETTVPVAIWVRPVDDADIEGPHITEITHSISNSNDEAIYPSSLRLPSHQLVIEDDEIKLSQFELPLEPAYRRLTATFDTPEEAGPVLVLLGLASESPADTSQVSRVTVSNNGTTVEMNQELYQRNFDELGNLGFWSLPMESWNGGQHTVSIGTLLKADETRAKVWVIYGSAEVEDIGFRAYAAKDNAFFETNAMPGWGGFNGLEESSDYLISITDELIHQDQGDLQGLSKSPESLVIAMGMAGQAGHFIEEVEGWRLFATDTSPKSWSQDVFYGGSTYNGGPLGFTIRPGYQRYGVAALSIKLLSLRGDLVEVTEDTPLLINLADGQPQDANLTFELVSLPLYGGLTQQDSELTYTPNKDYFGRDAFTYTVLENQVILRTVRTEILVTAVDDLPLAQPQNWITREDSPLPIRLSGVDPDGDVMSFEVTQSPVLGALSGTPPNLYYTPETNMVGMDQLWFRVFDGTSYSTEAKVEIEIIPVNDPPEAQPADYSGIEDVPLEVTLVGSDIEGDSLTYQIVTQPTWGSLTGSGLVRTYTPELHFNGTDHFQYRVFDGQNYSDVARVELQVEAVNDPPVAQAQTVEVLSGEPNTLQLFATDPDGDSLTFTLVTLPELGMLSGSPPSLIYTAQAGLSGTDSFTFVATDGLLTSEPITVNLSITVPIVPPLAVRQVVAIEEDGQGQVILSATSDREIPFEYRIESHPIYGSLAGTPPMLTYIPSENFDGSDQFTFVAIQEGIESLPGKIELEVIPSNDPHRAISTDQYTQRNEPIMFNLEAEDPDSTNQFEWLMIQHPAQGTLQGEGNLWTYTPRENFIGKDEIIFSVSDEEFGSSEASIQFYVVENDARSESGPPILQVFGSMEFVHEAGTPYIDPGAVATDFEDGLVEAILSGDVNPGQPGDYLLTYRATDSDGNQAVARERQVAVRDTIAPVISLQGAAIMVHEWGVPFEDPGATALDSFDPVVFLSQSTQIDPFELGIQEVIYTAEDSAGNSSPPLTRVVEVRDTTPPVITLLGAPYLILNYGDPFIDPGAEAIDTLDGSLEVNASREVNSMMLGIQTISYTSSDASGNNATAVTRTVQIIDTVGPTITMIGSPSIQMAFGTSYVDPGATAMDEVDGAVQVLIEGQVNTSLPGDYTIRYLATDSSNNSATPQVRNVKVLPPGDYEPPSIELIGDSTIDLPHGQIFIDPGVIINDNVDEDLTPIIRGRVNNLVPGIYTLTYTARDRSGNQSRVLSRNVRVIDNTGPTIFMNGDPIIQLELGNVFIDPGATAMDEVDGSVPVRIQGQVDTSKPGTYSLTYLSWDMSDNPATPATRSVSVRDRIRPKIRLLGLSKMEIPSGIPFIDPGAKATDNYDKDLSILTAGSVDVNQLGYYYVSYSTKDSSGNKAIPVIRLIKVVSDSPPMLTLIGQANLSINPGSVFIDPGVMAVDDRDPLTAVNVSGSVDTTTPGTYVLTYSAVDSSGNKAVPISRVVNVRDTSPPEVTLLGQRLITLSLNESFIDPGAVVTDNVDVDLEYLPLGTVDTSKPGLYILSYKAKDKAGNSSRPVNRFVYVVIPKDTTPPIIKLKGDTTIRITAGSPFQDPGCEVTDDQTAPVPFQVDGQIDTSSPGVYPLTYTAVDLAGNHATPMMRYVIVETPRDQLPPTIRLLGNHRIKIPLGTPYKEPGYVSSDNIDKHPSVTIIGAVNTEKPGIYVLTYIARDTAGNDSLPATRSIIIEPERDDVSPVIRLKGSRLISHFMGQVFQDPGTVVTDNLDTSINATVSGMVNANKIGTYTLTYTARDRAGNEARPVVRVIQVIKQPNTNPPVITLIGSVFDRWQRNQGVYRDPGARVVDTEDKEVAIQVKGKVDSNKAGYYFLTYTATDSDGNRAKPVTRVVLIEEGSGGMPLSSQGISRNISATPEENESGLKISRLPDGQIILTWSGAATLLRGAKPDQVTEVMTGATSPYVVPLDRAGHFYRILQRSTDSD